MALFQFRPDDSEDDYASVQAAVDSAASASESGGVLVTRRVDGSIRDATQTRTVPAGEVHVRQLDR